MKEIIQKVISGDRLSDEELALAIEHYRLLADLLTPHGDYYGLVAWDARMKLERLLSFKSSRQSRTKITA
jgi:hypothetical protein